MTTDNTPHAVTASQSITSTALQSFTAAIQSLSCDFSQLSAKVLTGQRQQGRRAVTDHFPHDQCREGHPVCHLNIIIYT